ncbi:hypothetical protein IWZ01DRAFT_558745 [Phyllosticta capitalensis]
METWPILQAALWTAMLRVAAMPESCLNPHQLIAISKILRAWTATTDPDHSSPRFGRWNENHVKCVPQRVKYHCARGKQGRVDHFQQKSLQCSPTFNMLACFHRICGSGHSRNPTVLPLTFNLAIPFSTRPQPKLESHRMVGAANLKDGQISQSARSEAEHVPRRIRDPDHIEDPAAKTLHTIFILRPIFRPDLGWRRSLIGCSAAFTERLCIHHLGKLKMCRSVFTTKAIEKAQPQILHTSFDLAAHSFDQTLDGAGV